MGSKMQLLVIKSGATYDMTNLVQSVELSGRKGTAARALTATLLDDDGGGRPRADIDVAEGVHCLFNWEGKELFRGIVEAQSQTRKKRLKITAHDNAISLSQNKDTFVYSQKKASEIFVDICKRYGLPYGQVDDTGYVIDELPKPKTTAWDAVCDALSLTYKATGARFWVGSHDGTLYLARRRNNILQWVIEAGGNLTDYTRTKSIEEVKTRIKAVSEEGTVLAEASNAALEEKIGIRQDIDQPDDTLSKAQLTALVKSMLAEESTPKESLDVSAIGIPDVVSGVGVFVIIPHLGLSRTYYVESDRHTFKRENHTMRLSLVSAADIDK